MVTSRDTRQFYEDAFTPLCRQRLRQGSSGLSELLCPGETLGLHQSRGRRDTLLPRKGKGPEGGAAPPLLHEASLKASWMPRGCAGLGVTPQGLSREHWIDCI